MQSFNIFTGTKAGTVKGAAQAKAHTLADTFTLLYAAGIKASEACAHIARLAEQKKGKDIGQEARALICSEMQGAKERAQETVAAMGLKWSEQKHTDVKRAINKLDYLRKLVEKETGLEIKADGHLYMATVPAPKELVVKSKNPGGSAAQKSPFQGNAAGSEETAKGPESFNEKIPQEQPGILPEIIAENRQAYLLALCAAFGSFEELMEAAAKLPASAFGSATSEGIKAKAATIAAKKQKTRVTAAKDKKVSLAEEISKLENHIAAGGAAH